MRRRALIAAAGAVLLLLGAASSDAHLKAIGGSLLDLLARSDGVLVARALGPTTDAPTSRTPMKAVRPLAGEAPREDFVLASAQAPLRYAAGQTAIVILERDGDGWTSVQLAGEGLVLDGDEVDDATAEFVTSAWKAVHAADPQGDLGALLRTGLRLPHPKVRLLAALDIAELAHHRPGLSEATRARLAADLEDPELDPAARLALSRALGVPPP